MRRLREVRGRDEGGRAVDENALCVLAGWRICSLLRASRVVEHRWLFRPGPVIFPKRPRVLLDCGVFAWRDIEDQDDFKFGTEGPCFVDRLEHFTTVEDTVRRNPKRLPRFGEKLRNNDARIADMRAFFVGAGPYQLDLGVVSPNPGNL